ncbi:MAG TPA: bacillithiol biosynthesis cysteine-adding enzyme BshC [Acidobacteriaceae bacterium]|nr:bacillithiol biosynthesis cysteine-adding enzyme BshC [Acidobacteriaceae bacterium]
MNADCYPVTTLPHATTLFRDYVSGASQEANNGLLDSFYSPLRHGIAWMGQPSAVDAKTRAAVVDLLTAQNKKFGAGTGTLANLDRLAAGANAVVTGQQVGLFGGPLLTLLKAATAIRRAEDASRAGHPHVPIFWLATEDHDLAEVNHAIFPDKTDKASVSGASGKESGKDDALRTLRLEMPDSRPVPVGDIVFGAGILPLLDQLRELLPAGPAYELLAALYRPEATYAEAFGKLLTHIFGHHGLIVIDASSRGFHALARPVLRAAIEQAAPLREALIERSRALEVAGYHAQVLVAESSSLLFLLDETTGERQALRHALPDGPKSGESDGAWTAGDHTYTTADLLDLLEAAPERISPNALLRPVMQDALLPTSVYIGGPSEIAYFAQSQVAYERILGRVTPILPRLSATLIERGTARLLAKHGLELTDLFTAEPEALLQRLGARYMPLEGKRRLATTGQTLDQALTALTAWMESLDAGLGRSAQTSASKIQYQMNRLRQMAANFELERAPVLRRHAAELRLHLYPTGHLQERVLAGAWFLHRAPEDLASLLVQSADGSCKGNLTIPL